MRGKSSYWHFGISSDTGPLKGINEDHAAFFAAGNRRRGGIAMAVLADGMGGYQAGDMASHLAVSMVHGWWRERVQGLLKQRFSFECVVRELRERMYHINEELLRIERCEEKKSGTTLSVLLFYRQSYLICHVGDSRVYCVPSRKNLAERIRMAECGDTVDLVEFQRTESSVAGRSLIQLTKDHSWVQTQVEAGRLSKEEARGHSKRNILVQCLGIDEGLNPFQMRDCHHPDDLFLLCSDGFYSTFSDAEIESMLNSLGEKNTDLQKACDYLVHVANQAGATDNVTVVLLRNCYFNKWYFRKWAAGFPKGYRNGRDKDGFSAYPIEKRRHTS